MAELHGIDPAISEAEGYTSPEEYSAQGDDRMIRNLRFVYSVQYTDDAGNTLIAAQEALRDQVVTLDQIGMLGLKKGEESHAFYTTEERERIEAGGDPDFPTNLPAGGELSAMGEYELAEYIKNNNLTVNDTIALAGTDKDMAQRVLQAENIATDGEPRKGVEAGLKSVIEG
jgi:hypothetical protein